MKLFFLRHGIASREHWNGLDSERPLTEEGVEQMQRLAGLFAKLETGVCKILTSPYTRARQTAEIAAPALDILAQEVISDERLCPGFGTGELRAILAEYSNCKALMLVGHEPDFSHVIGHVIGGGRITVKKASLIRVDLIDDDVLAGELVWLLTPKALSRLTRSE